jgi:hypothetical protein
MRTKTLLLSAAVGAAGLLAVNAQVYSVNSVGYINLTIPVGFSMIANQLNSGNNTVGSLFPAVADGTTLYKFNGVGYDINFYDEGWGNPAMTLNPGEGAFIRVVGSPLSVTFVGEVPQGSASNQTIPAGFSIRSSTVPQAASLDAMSFPAVDGDTVYRFNNATSSYITSVYDEGWGGGAPVVAVGEAFFVRKIGSASWNRNFSVNQ